MTLTFRTRLIACVGAVRYESSVVDDAIMSSAWFVMPTGEGCALETRDPWPYGAVREVGVRAWAGEHWGASTDACG